MEQRVKDMPVEARHWVEQLLGRPVREEETISVRSIPIVKDAPSLAERLRVADELDDYLASIDRKLAAVNPDEIEAAYDEAMLHVRPTYKPVR